MRSLIAHEWETTNLTPQTSTRPTPGAPFMRSHIAHEWETTNLTPRAFIVADLCV